MFCTRCSSSDDSVHRLVAAHVSVAAVRVVLKVRCKKVDELLAIGTGTVILAEQSF